MSDFQRNISVDENGIVTITLIGIQKLQDYIDLKNRVEEIGAERGGGLRILVDIAGYRGTFITRVGGMGFVQELDRIVFKLALIHADMFNWLMTQVLVTLAGVGHKVKVFKNEKEAKIWLMSGGVAHDIPKERT